MNWSSVCSAYGNSYSVLDDVHSVSGCIHKTCVDPPRPLYPFGVVHAPRIGELVIGGIFVVTRPGERGVIVVAHPCQKKYDATNLPSHRSFSSIKPLRMTGEDLKDKATTKILFEHAEAVIKAAYERDIVDIDEDDEDNEDEVGGCEESDDDDDRTHSDSEDEILGDSVGKIGSGGSKRKRSEEEDAKKKKTPKTDGDDVAKLREQLDKSERLLGERNARFFEMEKKMEMLIKLVQDSAQNRPGVCVMCVASWC